MFSSIITFAWLVIDKVEGCGDLLGGAFLKEVLEARFR